MKEYENVLGDNLFTPSIDAVQEIFTIRRESRTQRCTESNVVIVVTGIKSEQESDSV